MGPDVTLALIGILPQLLLLALVSVLAIRYRETIGQFMATRATSVSVLGVHVSLKPPDVEHAVRLRAGEPGQVLGSPALAGFGEQIVDRANRIGSHIVGRTILWVDDRPAGNRVERRLLRRMGIFVEAAASNGEAFATIDDPDEMIDLVISDVERDDTKAGLELAEALSRVPNAPRVILYVARLDVEKGTPPGAFGITNRPDVLLDLVMDALDRLPRRPGT